MSVPFDPERKHRRSIRLRGYNDRQAGAYFVTIVVQDRACLFGEVVDGQMRLNNAGRMVAAEWDTFRTRFINIDLDAFVVMPNHFHGVIVITGTIGKIGPDGSSVRAPLVGGPPWATS
jgi:putative transposase